MFRKYANVELTMDTMCENCGRPYGEHCGVTCPRDMDNTMIVGPKMLCWWECYVQGTDGGRHYRHWTLRSARIEAERLAWRTGEPVYVYECVGKCTPEITWEIPCL